MITKEQENLLYLLRCAIQGRSFSQALAERPELAQGGLAGLYPVAEKNKLVPVLYPLARQWAQSVGGQEAEMARWQAGAKRLLWREVLHQQGLHRLLAAARQEGLPLVVFKGPILAHLYPHYSQRTSGDTDVLVADEDRERGVALLERLGYVRLEKYCKRHVQVCRNGAIDHVVELHTRLWEDYEGKQIQALAALELAEPESLITAQACGLRFCTLGWWQHLAFQVFHIAKHFVLEGIGIRYLADLALFIDRHEAEIDFARFWAAMEALNYTGFSVYLFAACRRYLGMASSCGRPGFAAEAKEGYLQDMVQDMLNVGEVYAKSAAYQIKGAMTPYFTGEKPLKSSKLGRMMDVVFLRRKDLTAEYAYARKYPLLLPAAWLHRMTKYILGWWRNREIIYNVTEKLDVTEHRMYLLGEMELVEKKERGGR